MRSPSCVFLCRVTADNDKAEVRQLGKTRVDTPVQTVVHVAPDLMCMFYGETYAVRNTAHDSWPSLSEKGLFPEVASANENVYVISIPGKEAGKRNLITKG